MAPIPRPPNGIQEISMAILVTPQTKVLVQGITGGFGARHAQLSLDYGTQIVAGVTPGKGGQVFTHGTQGPDLRHGRRGHPGDRGDGLGGLRAAAVRRGRHSRGRRCRAGTGGVHHRGHSGGGHGPGPSGRWKAGPASDRAELPGHRHARDRARIRRGGCRIGIAPGYIHKAGHIGVVSRSGR
jgi:succinyl-CoA synthetase alpha subunit